MRPVALILTISEIVMFYQVIQIMSLLLFAFIGFSAIDSIETSLLLQQKGMVDGLTYWVKTYTHVPVGGLFFLLLGAVAALLESKEE